MSATKDNLMDFDDSGYFNQFYPFNDKRDYLLALAQRHNPMHKQAMELKQQRIREGKLTGFDNTKHWLDVQKEVVATEKHYSRSY